MTPRKPPHHPKWCTCKPDSPFLWMNNPRPSIFANTSEYRRSEAATASVEAQRAKGNEPGKLHSLSKRGETHVAATKEFFAKNSGKLNVFRKGKDNE